MKIRINNLKKSEENILKYKMYCIPFILIALTVILSASVPIPQDDLQNKDNLKDKKLDLLEKLESGKQVTSEDIWSSYRDNIDDDFLLQDPDFPPVVDILCLPSLPSLPDPFFYHNHDGGDHVIISDMDIREIHERLSQSIEELRKEIESFRNSEDFVNMQEELRKWSDEFKKDIGKLKEDIIRSGRETRSKREIHPIM